MKALDFNRISTDYQESPFKARNKKKKREIALMYAESRAFESNDGKQSHDSLRTRANNYFLATRERLRNHSDEIEATHPAGISCISSRKKKRIKNGISPLVLIFTRSRNKAHMCT